jgi:peroxiredoxin Q/BCP
MNSFLITIGIFAGITVASVIIMSNYKKQATPKLKVGDTAPLFTLPDETDTPRSLTEFSGKKVVLYFYPKDGTPGCTTEACGLRDSFEQFTQHDIVVIGVSYDSPESHKNFKAKERLPFILLSDSKRTAAHLYGTDQHAMGSLYPLRQSFLINEQGIIVHIMDNVTPDSHASDLLKAFGL